MSSGYLELSREELEEMLDEAELAGNNKMIQYCMSRIDEIDNTEDPNG